MDYRCSIRGVTRALGMAFGLAVATTAYAVPTATEGFQNDNKGVPDLANMAELTWEAALQGGEDPMLDPIERGPNPMGGACNAAATSCQIGPGTTANTASIFDVYDDFQPAVAGTFTKFCIQGLFAINPGTGFAQCGTASTRIVNWRLNFYPSTALKLPNCAAAVSTAVNALQTGNRAIFSNEVSPPSGARAFGAPVGVSTSGTFGAFTRFIVGFDLGTGLSVTPGSCYWVQPQFLEPAPATCWFLWEQQAVADTAGDNIGAQTIPGVCLTLGDLRTFEFTMCFDLTMQSGAVGGACPLLTAPSNGSCATRLTVPCETSVIVNNLLEPNDPADPQPSCDARTNSVFATTWYQFRPDADSGGNAVVDLCEDVNSLSRAAILVAYRFTNPLNPCGSLVEIGCANRIGCTEPDPGGGGNLKASLCLSNLSLTQDYIVMFATFNNTSNRGGYTLRVRCPGPVLPPANDECVNAISTTMVPTSVINGTTACSNIDQLAYDCGTDVTGIGGGIWYKFVGTGNLCRLDMCIGGTTFDSQLSVYCGACDALVCVAGADDEGPCSPQTQLDFCTEAGKQYFLLIHGFRATGPFNISISEIGACPPPVPAPIDCSICTIPPCPAEHVEEAEACGANVNGGCNLTPPVFEPTTCGTTICGRAWGLFGTRDTDWFSFTLSQRSVVTWSVQAEFEPVAFMFNDQCGGAQITFGAVAEERCGTATTSSVLNGGNYVVALANNGFNGFPCTGPSRYTATLTCDPIGCCVVPGGDCCYTTAADCAALTGTFNAAGTISGVGYTQPMCADTFEGPAGTDLMLGDDDAVIVNLPFAFKYWQERKTQVAVVDNGYITFDFFISAAVPTAIPSGPTPVSDFIAPYRRDLDPTSLGLIRAATVGMAPNRRFYVVWEDVAAFNSPDIVTFEVVLFEGSNEIGFRYASPMPGVVGTDFRSGIESPDGNSGYDVSTAAAAGNCIRFAPTTPTCDCAVTANEACCFADGSCMDITPAMCVASSGTPQGPGSTCATAMCITPCCGDVNGDRRIGVADVAGIILCWGQPAACNPAADLDGSGDIGVGDVAVVILNWAECCPGATPPCGGGEAAGGPC